MNTQRHFKPFLIAVVVAGTAALVFSATRLTADQLDWRFLLLVASMATVASRLSIPIPYVKGQVTVGDTIVLVGGRLRPPMSLESIVTPTQRLVQFVPYGTAFPTRRRLFNHSRNHALQVMRLRHA